MDGQYHSFILTDETRKEYQRKAKNCPFRANQRIYSEIMLGEEEKDFRQVEQLK